MILVRKGVVCRYPVRVNNRPIFLIIVIRTAIIITMTIIIVVTMQIITIAIKIIARFI